MKISIPFSQFISFFCVFFLLISNVEAQTKKLKRPKSRVGISSVDSFVKESFDLYDKVYMYDGYAEAGTPLDDEDIDVLEDALDDLTILSESAPDILSDVGNASVLKQAKATLQINRAKKALKYSIKTVKELLSGKQEQVNHENDETSDNNIDLEVSSKNDGNNQIDGAINSDVKNISKTQKVATKEQGKYNVEKIDKTNKHTNRGITIKPINSKFLPIKLQEHNGLPRLGVLNTFGAQLRKNQMSKEEMEEREELREAYKVFNTDKRYYIILLKTKFLGEYYNVINKQMPYTLKYKKGHIPENENKSAIAQRHLLDVATNLTTNEYYNTVFSQNIAYYHQRNRTASWGGIGANEFEEVKSYKSFVNDNFNDLRTQTNSLPDQVYFVKTNKFEDYDFSKGGFPIEIRIPTDYAPIKGYESAMKKHFANGPYTPISAIIKMSSDDAEEFLNKNESKPYSLKRAVYVVFKIKYYKIDEIILSYNIKSTSNANPQFYLSSPNIEIYSDEALKNKIGEINIQ